MSMIRNLARGCALSVLAAALVAPVAVYAQETTSSIRGAVTGPNGPIAGATATIVHVPSGTRATARSNADGLFVANGLRVGGPFTVDVTADGFQSTQVSDVFLQVGEPLRLPELGHLVNEQGAGREDRPGDDDVQNKCAKCY